MINCKHYPMTFIPGFSALRGKPQDPEENAEAYALSQQQRALERKLRYERRDLEVLKAQGADADAIRAQEAKVSRAIHDIDTFCDETGRARRSSREFTPVDAKWPKVEPDTMFPTETRDRINEFFGGNSHATKDIASDIISSGDGMDSQQIIDSHKNDRRTYGKRTGLRYDATLGDEVELYEEVRIKNTSTGEFELQRNLTGLHTVPQNQSTDTPMIYSLPSGNKTFLAFDDTRDTIMTNGRIAISKRTSNDDTRARITELLENEIDVLGGIRKDGVFYRVSDNPKDIEYIKDGTIRASINHMTGEKEDGLSVWERPKYYGKYMERLSGQVIGIGADGEPLLDVSTVTLLEPISIKEGRQKGRNTFLKLYRWTEEQLDKALSGPYKVYR